MARTDTERLDWLDKHPHDQSGVMGEEQAKFWGFYGKRNQTLRQIIDDAMGGRKQCTCGTYEYGSGAPHEWCEVCSTKP